MFILQCTAELILNRIAPGPLHGLGVVDFAPCTTLISLEELKVLSQKVDFTQKKKKERACIFSGAHMELRCIRYNLTLAGLIHFFAKLLCMCDYVSMQQMLCIPAMSVSLHVLELSVCA